MIPRFYGYMHYAGIGLGVALLIGWVSESAANGLGKMTGDSLATASSSGQDLNQPNRPRAWVAPLLFGAAALFIVHFVATAAPPTSVFQIRSRFSRAPRNPNGAVLLWTAPMR